MRDRDLNVSADLYQYLVPAVICGSRLAYNRYEKIQPFQDFAFRNVDYDGGKRCHNNALTTVQP